MLTREYDAKYLTSMKLYTFVYNIGSQLHFSTSKTSYFFFIINYYIYYNIFLKLLTFFLLKKFFKKNCNKILLYIPHHQLQSQFCLLYE